MRITLYRIIAVVCLLMLAVSSVQASGFSPSIGELAWSPDGQSLLYTVYTEGVFLANLDGETKRIADYFDRAPEWLPDGQSILSTLQVNDQTGIFRTPITGGKSIQLTEDVGWRPDYYAPNGMQPRVSPDGNSIAFLSLREGDDFLSLYTMTADGKDERALTDVGVVYGFAWSPDGQSIAFTAAPSGSNGGADLFLVDSFGTKLRRLTTTLDVWATWTPDGQRILFTSVSADGIGRIETIDADGQNRKVFRENAVDPIFSPDGTKILFTTPNDGWPRLSIMSANPRAESDDITITLPGERAYYSPDWSPDSQHIAFVSFLLDDPKGEEIVVVNADGSDPQVVISFPVA